jgi:hypothetical protein
MSILSPSIFKWVMIFSWQITLPKMLLIFHARWNYEFQFRLCKSKYKLTQDKCPYIKQHLWYFRWIWCQHLLIKASSSVNQPSVLGYAYFFQKKLYRTWKENWQSLFIICINFKWLLMNLKYSSTYIARWYMIWK